MSSPFKYIVTGGAGFIGSAVVWSLNQRGEDDILIVDELGSSEKWKNLAPLRFVDYWDKDELLGRLDSLSGVQAIVHLGACSSTTETDAAYMMRNNYAYTRDLAAWAVANGVKFIYASSAATYGDGSAGMEDGAAGLDQLRPLNVYGYSKHRFDQYAARQGWFDQIVGLKYFNVFGPNEDHKADMRSLVGKAYDQIKTTGRLKLFKSADPAYQDGEFGRDFVYVKDAVEMTLHFLDQKVGGLFNVGSGQMHTWNELAAAIFAALDAPSNIEFIEMPEQLRDRYQYHTQADLTRIKRAGYERPLTDLNAAVTDYVRNYLKPDRRLGDEPHEQ